MNDALSFDALFLKQHERPCYLERVDAAPLSSIERAVLSHDDTVDCEPSKGVRVEQPEIVKRPRIHQQLQSVPPKRKVGVLIEYLQRELAKALQLRESPDISQGFRELGVDSLLAVEFGEHLRREFQGAAYISSTALFEYPNIIALSDYLLGQLNQQPQPKQKQAAQHAD